MLIEKIGEIGTKVKESKMVKNATASAAAGALALGIAGTAEARVQAYTGGLCRDGGVAQTHNGKAVFIVREDGSTEWHGPQGGPPSEGYTACAGPPESP